ncbi:MAG: lipase maturation factor family protein, partial [Halobacteriales archaeon]
FKLVNTYGAFGSITTDRFQLVIEGTDVADPEEDDWQAYTFKGQPVRLDERPPQWAPYHLRLDWQLWFAAMSPSPRRHGWVLTLLERLLEGDEQLRKLLESDPFADEPPRFVRVLRYRYEFTSLAVRAETGRWWERNLQDVYVLPVSLQDLQSTGRSRQW